MDQQADDRERRSEESLIPRLKELDSFRTDELTDDTINALAHEVRLCRMVSSTGIRWPLAVKVTSRSRHQAPDAALAMAVAAGKGEAYVRFLVAEDAPDRVGFTIDLLQDRVVIHGAKSSLTYHASVDDRALEAIAADVVLGVGLVLGSTGHADAAAALISISAPLAEAFQGDSMSRAVDILVRGRRVSEALTVGAALAAQGRWPEAVSVVGTVAVTASDLMSREEREAIVVFEQRLAESAEASGDTREAAAVYYTLGNWLSAGLLDCSRALPVYVRARELDDTYARRDYFLRELAHAHFACGQYREAVAVYRELLDNGMGDQGSLARLADSLLLTGQYSESAEAFTRYLAAPVPSEPVWILRAAIAHFLVARGLLAQDRNEDAAAALALEAAGLEDPSVRVAKAEEALAHDALCFDAYRVVGLAIAGYDPQAASVPLIVAALAARQPILWALTVHVLVGAGDDRLARAATAHALIEDGPGLRDALRKGAVHFDTQEMKVAMSLVQDVEATLVEPKNGFTLRTATGNGVIVERRFTKWDDETGQ
ncbi:MAG: tetratricopeptide repeat protein [Acidimicrobiales bacterium]